MARQLNEFPERPNRQRELERYLDGTVWELTQGDDFTGKPESFVSTARELAKARGGRLRTRKVESDPTTLVIQFVQ
jgi:hypothetical protein